MSKRRKHAYLVAYTMSSGASMTVGNTICTIYLCPSKRLYERDWKRMTTFIAARAGIPIDSIAFQSVTRF